MVHLGAQNLINNAEQIDALNVFPVPDGDTGTNMKLSIESGVQEINSIQTNHLGEIALAFAKGLLMGARGNSGVILSQIFRGFAKGLEQEQTASTVLFAQAFESGVVAAYKAVMKPVEGTILTVAKDAANKAIEVAAETDDLIELMTAILEEAKASLKRTPDLLPVLKEVGVVDSGGQGLVMIYEGFLAGLKGEQLPEQTTELIQMNELVDVAHHKIAQNFMNTADIEYGYCTEFMVQFEADKLKQAPFDETAFRDELGTHGDSLVVVSDEDVAKVHIHTEYPGNAMTLGQRFGSLINIKVENMREQHIALVGAKEVVEPLEKAAYAIIAVAAGSGIHTLFKSLGATVIIEGGQTMNPSTLDITNAITQANAENIIILPNNKNIIMAAMQAAEIANGNVVVVQTKTIPQGISALFAFQSDVDLSNNLEVMSQASRHVKTGQVTYAVRDTKLDGIMLEKGHFIGINEGKIEVTDIDPTETAKLLLEKMIDNDAEIITVLYGADIDAQTANEFVAYIEERYAEIEVEAHFGNQPIYSYIIAVE